MPRKLRKAPAASSHSTSVLDSKAIVKELQSVHRFGNESDVREDFVFPLLKALGYSNAGTNAIERNIYLNVSKLIVGTKSKSLEGYSPDYVLSVNGKRKWLIDAKGPKESILDRNHISQAYSYAIHKEINVPSYVLCNGEELAIAVGRVMLSD